MDKNEDEIPDYEREIDFEDLDDEPQMNSKLVENLEKTRTFLVSFWVTKGCGNKNSTAEDGG